MTFERHQVALYTGELSYLVAGEGEPLLYLHPAGGAMITEVIQGLAKFRKVYVPILPGFDGTARHAGVDTVVDLANLAAEFSALVIGEAPDVMGASFGGWIALWMAAKHPKAVGRLVLEAPAGLRFGMDASSLTPEAARANLFAYPAKAAAIAPTRETAIANGQAFGAYMNGVFVDQDLVAALPTIAAHTLVLMGTLDVTIPAETGWALTSTLPHVNLTYVWDAAHAAQVDQPAACLRIIRPFLEKGPAFIVASREYA
jgi:pimeloyl-ACP methyl ester carboxylesterase